MRSFTIDHVLNANGKLDLNAMHDKLDELGEKYIAVEEKAIERVVDAARNVFAANPNAALNLAAIVFGTCRALNPQDATEHARYERIVKAWVTEQTERGAIVAAKAESSGKGSGVRGKPPTMYRLCDVADAAE